MTKFCRPDSYANFLPTRMTNIVPRDLSTKGHSDCRTDQRMLAYQYRCRVHKQQKLRRESLGKVYLCAMNLRNLFAVSLCHPRRTWKKSLTLTESPGVNLGKN